MNRLEELVFGIELWIRAKFVTMLQSAATVKHEIWSR